MVGAGSLAAWAQGAQVATAPAGPGPVTVRATFDVADAYVLRGLGQDDTGVIMWPAVDVGIRVLGESADRSTLRINLGTWNSLHTGAVGRDGYGKLWYQSDFYAGVGLGVGRGLEVGATYLSRTSPNNGFPSVTEFVASVGAPRHWVAPYALVAFELEGQLDGGRNKGRYLELGARPSIGRRFTVAMPTKIGVSLGDYYEGLRGDDRFGFFSIGGMASAPLGGALGGRGGWNVHAGVDYIRLGDRNALVFGKDNQVVVSGGLGLSY
jgi:hypothetical protein